jgi:hypothetical protein
VIHVVMGGRAIELLELRDRAGITVGPPIREAGWCVVSFPAGAARMIADLALQRADPGYLENEAKVYDHHQRAIVRRAAWRILEALRREKRAHGENAG